MFTGIIETTAKVLARTEGQLTLERPAAFHDVASGSSIAVSGACLTVTAFDDRTLVFDVMPETLKKTTLGTLRPGDCVNLERALPAHGRFEGHVVQGHVEGVGTIVGVLRDGADVRLTIRVPADVRNAIVAKGSVAVDGISLTVANVAEETFGVALIPMTLSATTLGGKAQGDQVNIETDILVRTLIALR